MIGFKNTNNKVAIVEPKVSCTITDVEDFIKMKGWQEAQIILQEYFATNCYPLLDKEKRDQFFIERLRKVRERYFLPI